MFGVLRSSLIAAWLVGEDRDTRSGCLRSYKLQPLQIAPVLEKTLTTPDDHRMDHERQFVEEIILQQGVHERRATGDANVLAGLLLQPGDFFREICLDKG